LPLTQDLLTTDTWSTDRWPICAIQVLHTWPLPAPLIQLRLPALHAIDVCIITTTIAAATSVPPPLLIIVLVFFSNRRTSLISVVWRRNWTTRLCRRLDTVNSFMRHHITLMSQHHQSSVMSTKLVYVINACNYLYLRCTLCVIFSLCSLSRTLPWCCCLVDCKDNWALKISIHVAKVENWPVNRK